MNALTLFNSLFNEMEANPYTSFPSFDATVTSPRVDVTENKDNYSLEMELPGLKQDDVQIELKDNVLSVSSHKEENKTEKGKKDGPNYLIKERRTFDFSRRFTLPQDIDAEAVKANFEDGILNICIPKKAIAAPKRILINATSSK